MLTTVNKSCQQPSSIFSITKLEKKPLLHKNYVNEDGSPINTTVLERARDCYLLRKRIRTDTNISPAIERFYMDILYYYASGRLCYASKRRFADKFNVCERTIYRWLSTLEDYGYIYRDNELIKSLDHFHHTIRINLIDTVKDISARAKASLKQYVKNFNTNVILDYWVSCKAIFYIPKCMMGAQNQPKPKKKKKKSITFKHNGITYQDADVRQALAASYYDERFKKLFELYPSSKNRFGAFLEWRNIRDQIDDKEFTYMLYHINKCAMTNQKWIEGNIVPCWYYLKNAWWVRDREIDDSYANPMPKVDKERVRSEREARERLLAEEEAERNYRMTQAYLTGHKETKPEVTTLGKKCLGDIKRMLKRCRR